MPVILIPRVTDMRDGTFRPEMIVANQGLGNIHFGPPRPTIEEAQRIAQAACDAGDARLLSA